MPLLTSQNIESEISYAYLHAVCAKAGMSCQVADRHLDGAGVDATISAYDKFAPDSTITDISIHVQLKATTMQPRRRNGRLPYFMSDVSRYGKLRNAGTMPIRILVVLFLPRSNSQWLTWSDQCLTLQRCAYWVSLRNAPESTNKSGQTIYLPESQAFSPNGLRMLMVRLSRKEDLIYEV